MNVLLCKSLKHFIQKFETETIGAITRVYFYRQLDERSVLSRKPVRHEKRPRDLKLAKLLNFGSESYRHGHAQCPERIDNSDANWSKLSQKVLDVHSNFWGIQGIPLPPDVLSKSSRLCQTQSSQTWGASVQHSKKTNEVICPSLQFERLATERFPNLLTLHLA
jgi:hypothetical protein